MFMSQSIDVIEKMAEIGYGIAIARSEHLMDEDVKGLMLSGWENQSEALRDDWRAIAQGMLSATTDSDNDCKV